MRIFGAFYFAAVAALSAPATVAQAQDNMAAMEGVLERMEAKIDALDERLNAMDSRMSALHSIEGKVDSVMTGVSSIRRGAVVYHLMPPRACDGSNANPSCIQLAAQLCRDFGGYSQSGQLNPASSTIPLNAVVCWE